MKSRIKNITKKVSGQGFQILAAKIEKPSNNQKQIKNKKPKTAI